MKKSPTLKPAPGPTAAQALEELILLGRRDPAEWVRRSFRVEPSSQQVQGCDAVRDLEEVLLRRSMGAAVPEHLAGYVGRTGISIRSGNGTGKDTFMAWMMIRQQLCFPRPKGLATAPAAHQVQSIMWAEVSKWLNKRDEAGDYVCPFRDLIQVQATKIFYKPTGGKESFIEPRTANPNDTEENQAETLAGRHEDYLTIFMTEASGVPDPVFRPLERTLTGKCNYAILAWNPTRTKGFAHATHFSDARDSWVCLHWDAEESELVSRDHIAKLEKKYGRDSNMFRVGVKGHPPKAERGTLIPYELVDEAVGREFDIPDGTPTRQGNDIGRTGDKSAVLIRRGPEVEFGREFQKDDLVAVAAEVTADMSEFEPEGTFLDVNGLGWGVYDIVKVKKRSGVYPVNVTRAATKPDRFYQLRDELYWAVREAFMEGKIAIRPGPWVEDLKAQLTSLKYDDDVQRQDKRVIKIWSKRKMKEKGLPSPNLADALALTFYLPDTFFSSGKDGKDEKQDRWKDRFKRARNNRRGDHTWMGV